MQNRCSPARQLINELFVLGPWAGRPLWVNTNACGSAIGISKGTCADADMQGEPWADAKSPDCAVGSAEPGSSAASLRLRILNTVSGTVPTWLRQIPRSVVCSCASVSRVTITTVSPAAQTC